jgi:hypothetical protein
MLSRSFLASRETMLKLDRMLRIDGELRECSSPE